MRVAVVGHVEWVDFAAVQRLPAAGEIVHATGTFSEPGGGGGVAAVALARLAGEATLFTALGSDELARRSSERLEALGVRVYAARRPDPTRRAFTFLDARGERTITVLGERMVPLAADDLPWEDLAAHDAIYFTGGDAGALEAARAAEVLTATARAGEVLLTGVALDALVGSGRDPGERLPRPPSPAPALTVETFGSEGGRYSLADGTAGRYGAVAVPGPVRDAYGAGDSFAAGLTYALGRGLSPEEALAAGARSGAECVTLEGPYGSA